MNGRDLYQDILMDHFHRPRHHGELVHPTHRSVLSNPLCGDQVTVSLRVSDDCLTEVASMAKGCAICVASASIMAAAVHERTVSAARLQSAQVCELVRSEVAPRPQDTPGDLQALLGVRDFPMRHRCATLAWEALAEALAAVNTPADRESKAGPS